MNKLSDTQLVILSAACGRDDRLVLPLPERLKGGAAAKVIQSLLARKLVREVKAGREHPVWRQAEDGRNLTLVATDAAFEALGIEAETGPAAATGGGKKAAGAKAAPKKKGRREAPKAGTGRKPRDDSKQARLVEMLRRPEGASIAEIAEAFGWQHHTVRGAIAGALKKKLGLEIVSETTEERGRVYRIAA
jgi:Protein of unknown function (DUF3489)